MKDMIYIVQAVPWY